MERDIDIDKLMFPVELRDLYYNKSQQLEPQLLFLNEQTPSDKELSKLERYKVLINASNGYPFTVVTNNYAVITNYNAMVMAELCFSKLFPNADIRNIEIFNIITSEHFSFCHIDIVHKEHILNIGQSEIWVPYLRVTNSYNKTKALRFDLGFCRKICNNGLIFEKETIKFKYLHTKNKQIEAKFNDNVNKLKNLEKEFVDYMNELKGIEIPSNVVVPLAAKALQLKFGTNPEKQEKSEKSVERQEDFKKQIDFLRGRYYGDMGANAYAFLNIISDFASNNRMEVFGGYMTDSLQKRVGNWVSSFIQESNNLTFTVQEYVKDWLEYII